MNCETMGRFFDFVAGYQSGGSCNVGCCEGMRVTQFIGVGHIAKLMS